MKKLFRNIFRLLVIVLIIVGCEKEADVVTSFDFNLEETHSETIVINHPEETTFSIQLEQEVTTTIFSFKYETIQGDGGYINTKGEKIPENEYIKLTDLSFKMPYKSSSILEDGSAQDKVKVSIKDNYGLEKQIEITYTVVHNEFTIEALSPINQADINQSRSVNISLFNTGKDDSVTFKISYFISKGTGILLNEDESNLIPLEESIDLREGTYNYNLQFKEFGEAQFLIVATDSNGQTKTVEVDYNVKDADFTFTAESIASTALANTPVGINFLINPTSGTGIKYTMSFTSEITGTLTYGGVEYETNTPFPVPTGSFSGTFMSSIGGIADPIFIIRASNNSQETAKVDLEITQFEFEIEIPETINIVAGDEVSFQLFYEASRTDVDAQLFYTVSDVTVELTSGSILPSPYSLPLGATNLIVPYNSIGSYTINWNYVNNLGSNLPYTTIVNVVNREFSLSTTGSSSVPYGSESDITLNISTDNSPLSYRIDNYSFSSGNGLGLFGKNGNTISSSQALNLGDNVFIVKTLTSNTTLTINVVDSYGYRKTISKTINVLAPNVTYSNTINTIVSDSNCGSTGGERRTQRTSTRTISIKNNNASTINSIQTYSTSDVLLNSRSVTINPGETGAAYEISCTTTCNLSSGGCEPSGDFKIRYRIGTAWSNYEDFKF